MGYMGFGDDYEYIFYLFESFAWNGVWEKMHIAVSTFGYEYSIVKHSAIPRSFA